MGAIENLHPLATDIIYSNISKHTDVVDMNWFHLGNVMYTVHLAKHDHQAIGNQQNRWLKTKLASTSPACRNSLTSGVDLVEEMINRSM